MCRSFPTRQPAEVLGIDDEVVAADFNNTASFVLRVADQRLKVEELKLQHRMMWGGGGKEGDDSPQANKHVNLQKRANAFFGT